MNLKTAIQPRMDLARRSRNQSAGGMATLAGKLSAPTFNAENAETAKVRREKAGVGHDRKQKHSALLGDLCALCVKGVSSDGSPDRKFAQAAQTYMHSSTDGHGYERLAQTCWLTREVIRPRRQKSACIRVHPWLRIWLAGSNCGI